MISEAAKAAFRRRAGMAPAFNDFSPGFVARIRAFATSIGGSDPFAEAEASVAPAVVPIAANLRPAAPPPVASTPVDREFERVRAAALARQEAERQARAEEDAAVAFILSALARARG